MVFSKRSNLDSSSDVPSLTPKITVVHTLHVYKCIISTQSRSNANNEIIFNVELIHQDLIKFLKDFRQS